MTETYEEDRAAWTMWVIYERPRDFPHSYVLRRWVLDKDGGNVPDVLPIAVDLELDNVRAKLPDGATLLHGRGVDPDPVIVEVYV
jgi:hypothetical protein